MSGSRLVGAVLTAAVSVAGVVTVPTPAAAAVVQGPRLLVSAVQPVESGEPTWVKAYWTSRRDVCDVRVTLTSWDVLVDYPENTGSFTSFRRHATLAAGLADYTAFRVTAESKRSRVFKLEATVTYTQLPRGTFGPGVDPEAVPCEGRERARVTWIKLPVLGERDS